jgi:hypothetical protein
MHAPDDLLALHATGDPLPPEVQQHVAHCSQCRGELSQWNALVATGRATTYADVPGQPPPRVWEAISAELALDTSAVTAEPAESQAEVISLDSRRRWSTSWLVAASVVGIVGGAVLATGGIALTDSGSDPAPVAAPPVVATASLTALPEHQGDGAAEIVETDTGTELVVDVSDLSSGEGFYEVWLIDPDTFQMIGLGALTDTSGRFPVPEGLDLSRYTVVDVSLEPLDGDPVHSTDSVVRGELST